MHDPIPEPSAARAGAYWSGKRAAIEQSGETTFTRAEASRLIRHYRAMSEPGSTAAWYARGWVHGAGVTAREPRNLSPKEST